MSIKILNDNFLYEFIPSDVERIEKFTAVDAKWSRSRELSRWSEREATTVA